MKRGFKLLGIFFLSMAFLLLSAVLCLPLKGNIPVLMYHFIEEGGSSNNAISLEAFERQMEVLEKLGFHVLTMDEYYDIHTGSRPPRGKEILITFDDGHQSFSEKAFPILKKHQFPVMMFLISENVKEGLHGSMTAPEVRELLKDPLFDIGAHTKTHSHLTEILVEAAKEEIKGSKTELENLFQRPVRYFAYPFGDFDSKTRDIVQDAGYRLAFTTSPKKLKTLKENRYSLTRIKITPSSDDRVIFWAQITGLYSSFKKFRHEMKQPRYVL